MNPKHNKIIYLITFFAGFSFLVYEISWNRYLSLTLGATVTASTIVLMAFMTGFGFGSKFLGKKIDKSKNYGKLLSFLLAAVGIISILNFFLIDNGQNYFYDLFTNFITADIFFTSLVFILLTIPAFFMGGVIPLVSKIVISEKSEMSDKLGKIYTFETLGSTLGGLITGFFLLGKIGQTNTIITAFVINFLIAVFLFFSKKFSSIKVIAEQNNSNKKDVDVSTNSRKIAVISTLLFGFTILSLQIIWIRIFKTYFTNTSYTFTLITSFVILGLSIGSWIYKKNASKIKNNENTIVKMLIFLTLFSLAGLLIIVFLPELLLLPFSDLIENTFFRIIIIPFIASLLIVIPPTIISGFSFPLACRIYTGNISEISKSIGNILTSNTIGSVLGPAITTFIFIPLLGCGKSMLIILLTINILSFYLLKLNQKKNEKTQSQKNYLKYISSAVSIAIIIFIIFGKQIQFVPPSVKIMDKEMLSYKETVEGTIIVVNEEEKGIFGNSTFINNSAVIGSNYDAIKAVKMVGQIPFFSGLKCEKVLIIGFGIGVTTSAIASHSEVKSIDCIELMPDLKDFAFYYEYFNSGVYNDDRLNIIKGDGRHYLQISNETYDLISCDPTHPVLGSGGLYTKEYFEQCYEHLNENGMVSQYLPLHKLSLKNLLGIIKTFNSVFSNSTVWLGQYHAILFGKKGNEKTDFNSWKSIIETTSNDEFLYLEPYHIAACAIFDNEAIHNFDENIKINTDDLNYTEFFSFDNFDAENIYNNLLYLSENRCNLNNIFSNIDNQNKLDTFVAGNINLTKSLYYSLKGENDNALNSLREACLSNPENQEYPFLIKFYYGIN